MESIAKRTYVSIPIVLAERLYDSMAVKRLALYIFHKFHVNFRPVFGYLKLSIKKSGCPLLNIPASYRTRTSQLPKLLALTFYWTWSFSARKTDTHLCSREWFNATAGAPEKAPGFTVRAVNNEMAVACACGCRNQHGSLECKMRRDRVVMLRGKNYLDLVTATGCRHYVIRVRIYRFVIYRCNTKCIYNLI